MFGDAPSDLLPCTLSGKSFNCLNLDDKRELSETQVSSKVADACLAMSFFYQDRCPFSLFSYFDFLPVSSVTGAGCSRHCDSGTIDGRRSGYVTAGQYIKT